VSAQLYALTLDDWIARTKARGHAMLEEKQLNFTLSATATSRTYGASYALHSDGNASRARINSIQRSK